jgi:hypothetical protein
MLIDKALNQGLRPVAARGTSPPSGGAGLSLALAQGQAIQALSRRRSRQPKVALSAIVSADVFSRVARLARHCREMPLAHPKQVPEIGQAAADPWRSPRSRSGYAIEAAAAARAGDSERVESVD